MPVGPFWTLSSFWSALTWESASALPWLDPLLLITAKLYSQSCSNHLASCPSGSFMLCSHCNELWSVWRVKQHRVDMAWNALQRWLLQIVDFLITQYFLSAFWACDFHRPLYLLLFVMVLWQNWRKGEWAEIEAALGEADSCSDSWIGGDEGEGSILNRKSMQNSWVL